MQRIEFRAMGCQMLAVLDRESPEAARHLAQVPDWFEAWEQSLSRFRADSELSRLNRRAGKAVPVSQVLWDVIEKAMLVAYQSKGLVSPTELKALEAAGYDRSFEELGQRAEMTQKVARGSTELVEVSPTRPLTRSQSSRDWQAIILNAATQTVILPAGTSLDLGGIAKGWAAEQAAARLSQWGAALVDAGGDIAVSGPMSDGQPWPIGVASPLGGEQELLLLLDRGGVATSGRDYRRWQSQKNGPWQHHIIDPRTGQPAQTDVLSATVIAPTMQEAEMAAKVVLIEGCRRGLLWLEARPTLAGLICCEDGPLIKSSLMVNYLW